MVRLHLQALGKVHLATTWMIRGTFNPVDALIGFNPYLRRVPVGVHDITLFRSITMLCGTDCAELSLTFSLNDEIFRRTHVSLREHCYETERCYVIRP